MAATRPDTTLVLGGSGFLGVHVVAVAGAGAVSASREKGPVEPARFVPLDARKPGDLDKVLAEVRPARVVDCAAYSSVGEAEKHPDIARAMNVDVPRTLARWCAKEGSRLVHVSTDLVFGASEPGPGGFREEDPPGPLSEYGRSKAAGEKAVLEEMSGALVVRLPLMYGESFGRGRGGSDSLLAAVRRGDRPVLFTDEWRTPLEVRNAAEALVELAGLDARGILHVAGPERVNRYDFAVTVLELRGPFRTNPADLITPSTRAEARMKSRPADVALDTTKARGILKTPLLGVREALEKVYGPHHQL